MGPWLYEAIKLLQDNFTIIKDNVFLFLSVAIICFCLSWILAKKIYKSRKVEYLEYEELKERVKELESINEKLEEQIRDLTTTERMLAKTREVKQEENMGKKIADALNKN